MFLWQGLVQGWPTRPFLWQGLFQGWRMRAFLWQGLAQGCPMRPFFFCSLLGYYENVSYFIKIKISCLQSVLNIKKHFHKRPGKLIKPKKKTTDF